jgi:hypothetical protein
MPAMPSSPAVLAGGQLGLLSRSEVAVALALAWITIRDKGKPAEQVAPGVLVRDY